jgi:hypothetical protein
MAGTSLHTLLLAASVACLGGCIPQPPPAALPPAAYIGRPVASFVADHGQPGLEVDLSDHQRAFSWDTLGHDIGPAIGTGLTVASAPAPSFTTICTVTLVASTQVPKPGLNDWIVRSWDRQGGC